MSTTVTYLLPYLRLKIGDLNPASYRYTDEWLTNSLLMAVSQLGRWWNFKYTVDITTNLVSRNTVYDHFIFPEPPTIEQGDEQIIITMAAYVILEGSLENSAWNIQSWRDNEIAVSNLESGRIRAGNLQKLWDELTSMLTPPSKKLVGTLKGSLPGYKVNQYEYGKEQP